MSTIDIQEMIADKLAKEIAAEIDFEIMSDLMGAHGWHKVKLDRFTNNEHAVDIKTWVTDHAVGKFINHSTIYIFEQKGDAINFALKWA